VRDLKSFIEAETTLPAASLSIYLNGQAVAHESQTLEAAGIRDGEMLAVVVRQPRSSAPPANPRPAAVNQPDAEGVRQQLLTNAQAQAQLRERDPELAATVHDAIRWREAFTMRQRQVGDAERERQNQIALLNDDPFNVEAQRKIEELIRQERVVENLEKAYNENPEGMSHRHATAPPVALLT
jgi:DNA damage-inducible protein 1